MGKITVWTKQHENVLEILETEGRYTAKREYIVMDLQEHASLVLEAYEWLVKNGPDAKNRPVDVEFPVWVSFEKDATMMPSEGTVILELELEEEWITHVNIAKWGTILNYGYIPADEKDAVRHKQLLSDYGTSDAKAYMSQFYPQIKRKIRESWKRLFEASVQLGNESDYGNIWGCKTGMDQASNTIRLYTYQTDVVVDAIKRDGVCFSKEAYVRKKYVESAGIFTTAYSWFVKETEKIVPKPEGAEYPYWAFKDLYNVDQTGKGNMMALDVPLDEVVLFDLYDWNKIICMKYIGENAEDEKKFHQMLIECGLKETDIMLTNFYPDWKQKILQSWSRLFRYDTQIKQGNTDCVGGVQAGLWRIRDEWIVHP